MPVCDDEEIECVNRTCDVHNIKHTWNAEWYGQVTAKLHTVESGKEHPTNSSSQCTKEKVLHTYYTNIDCYEGYGFKSYRAQGDLSFWAYQGPI